MNIVSGEQPAQCKGNKKRLAEWLWQICWYAAALKAWWLLKAHQFNFWHHPDASAKPHSVTLYLKEHLIKKVKILDVCLVLLRLAEQILLPHWTPHQLWTPPWTSPFTQPQSPRAPSVCWQFTTDRVKTITSIKWSMSLSLLLFLSFSNHLSHHSFLLLPPHSFHFQLNQVFLTKFSVL